MHQVYLRLTNPIKEEWFSISSAEIIDLNDRNFIFNGSEIKLRDKGRLLFEEDNIKGLFEEFYNLFPTITPSGRRLRTSSADTKLANDAFVAYKRKIRKKEDHLNLINGLKIELKERDDNNSLEYINNILTWIRNATWELYESDQEGDDFSTNFIEIE